MLTIGQILLINTSSNNSQNNTYTVKSGDSLWKIAKAYGTTVQQLKSVNNLTSDNLNIGDTLIIPTTTKTYIVVKGDSLWSIAKKYNTTVNSLKTLNNLKSDIISIGQSLKIPN